LNVFFVNANLDPVADLQRSSIGHGNEGHIVGPQINVCVLPQRLD
jgi:hypothetical protein